MRGPKLTVTHKLVILLVSAAVLPLVIGGWIAYESSRGTLETQIRRHFTAQAHATAREISTLSLRVRDELDRYAHEIVLQTLVHDEVDPTWIELDHPGPPFDFLVLYSGDGRARGGTSRGHLPPGSTLRDIVKPLDPSWMKKTASRQTADASRRGPAFVSQDQAVERALPGCPTDYCMGFIAPLPLQLLEGKSSEFPPGTFLYGSVCWKYLLDELENRAREAVTMPAEDEDHLIRVALLESQGKAPLRSFFRGEILGPRASAREIPEFAAWIREGRREGEANWGEESYLVGLARSELGADVAAESNSQRESAWWVAVGGPTSAVLAPSNATRRNFLWILGLAAIAAGLVATFAGRRASAPLRALAQRAQQLGRSNSENEPLEVPTRDELGQLVESFNRLGADLHRKRKQASHLLEQYNNLIRSSPDAMLTLDLSGCVRNANPAAEELFSISLEETRGSDFATVLPQGQTPERWMAAIQHVAESHEMRSLEMTLEAASGDARRSYAALLAPIHNRFHRVVGLLLVLRDLSELRETERQLSEQNQILHRLYDLRLSSRGSRKAVYREAVRSLAEIFDVPLVVAWRTCAEGLEALGIYENGTTSEGQKAGDERLPCLQVLDRNRSVILDDAAQGDISGLCVGDIDLEPYLGSYLGVPIRGRDGEAVGLLCLLDPRQRNWGAKEEHWVQLFAEWIAIELELEELERRFLHHEKMASVGGLAAGMAHEINNPLGGVLQNLQLLRFGLDPDDDVAGRRLGEVGFDETSRDALGSYVEGHLGKYLDRIEDSGQRAAKIVADLLDFSRKRRPEFVEHSTEKILHRAADLAWVEYDLKKHYDIRNVDLRYEIQAGAERVLCDAHQIEQVLLNLIKNAAHALHRMAQDQPDFEPYLVLRARPTEGRGVVLEVEDNGPGISEVPPERIFEPFYTTKRVGEGTGLGLYVSYFLVTEGHGGQLRIATRPGEGTRFEIHLPGDVPPKVDDLSGDLVAGR